MFVSTIYDLLHVNEAKRLTEPAFEVISLDCSWRTFFVTNLEKPVPEVQQVPEKPISPLEELRGSVLFYQDPLEPVGVDDWEALK